MSDLSVNTYEECLELALYWAGFFINATDNELAEKGVTRDDALANYHTYDIQARSFKAQLDERRNARRHGEIMETDVINIHNIPGNVPVTIDAFTFKDGLAPHRYRLTSGNEHGGYAVNVDFQCVNPNTNGIVGITIEALVAVGIHRLMCYQDGPQRCRDNALAITAFEEGVLRLNARTLDRVRRDVKNKREA